MITHCGGGWHGMLYIGNCWHLLILSDATKAFGLVIVAVYSDLFAWFGKFKNVLWSFFFCLQYKYNKMCATCRVAQLHIKQNQGGRKYINEMHEMKQKTIITIVVEKKFYGHSKK